MDRKDFLRTACAFCGFAAVASFAEGCAKDGVTGPSVDFTIDLTNANYAALKVIGGSIHLNQLVIIRTGNGTFVALAEACTHEGCSVDYSGGQLVCPCHNGVFDLNGKVVSGPPPTALKSYITTLTGNSLHVKG